MLADFHVEEGNSQIVRNENQRAKMIRFWKKLWKAKVPNKVQLCIWRSSHESLPVLVNLHKRRIVTQKLCPLCGAEEETTFHVIRKCPKVSEVWMKIQLHEKWSIMDETNILD